MYADISPTYLLRAQRLQKAYRGYTQVEELFIFHFIIKNTFFYLYTIYLITFQNGNWPTNPDTCKLVMALAQDLMETSIKARKEAQEKDITQANQQLSSARLTGQAVIRAAEKQDWPDTKTYLDTLNELFSNVTEYMKSVL